tara:strand:- start:266 stop:964 length:699 start_codon:yes stop_codon:yes gene_type:complete
VGSSQTQKGTLLLRVFPVDAIVKIDGKKYVERDQNGFLKIELDSGMHFLQCWAPTHELIEDSIRIKANETVRKVQYISHSKEFQSFKQSKRRQAVGKTVLLVVPPAMLIGFTTEYFIKEPDMKLKVENSKTDVESTKQVYLDAITINTVKSSREAYERSVDNYNERVSEYNEFVTISAIKISASAVITGLSIWWVTKFKKLEYEEKQLLSRTKIILDPINGQAFLTWKIQKQ